MFSIKKRVYIENEKKRIIEVEVRADTLNKEGMVMDFVHIKEVVMKLDHSNLNDTVEQPTAENIAIYLAEEIQKRAELQENMPDVYSIKVIESENNEAIFYY